MTTGGVEQPTGCADRGLGRSAVAIVFVVAAVSLTWSSVNAVGRVFPEWTQSDTVWMYSLAADLFEDRGRFDGWSLSPHPNTFPELLTVDVARRLSQGLQGFFVAYSTVTRLALLVSTWFCLFVYLRAEGEDRRAHTRDLGASLLGAFAMNAGWLLLLNHGLFVKPLRYWALPAFHFGAFLMTLPAAFLALDLVGRRASGWRTSLQLGIALVVIAATVLSDKIAALNVIPGMLAAAAYHTASTRTPSRSVWMVAATVVAVTLIAMGSADSFWNVIAHANAYPVELTLSTFGPQMAVIAESLLDDTIRPNRHAGSVWIERVVVVATLAVAARLGVSLLSRLFAHAHRSKRREAAPAMQAFLLATAIALPIAVAMLGRFTDARALRFIIPTFYAVPLAIITLALPRLARRLTPRTALLSCALVAAFAVAFRIDPHRAPWHDFGAPPIVECLKQQAGTHDLRYGLGHHWHSHITTIGSSGSIVVRPISAAGRMQPWANQLDWFSVSRTAEPFTFVIVSPDLDAESIRERFGAPEEVLLCPAPEANSEAALWTPQIRTKAEIWVYPDDAAWRITRDLHRQYARWIDRLR